MKKIIALLLVLVMCLGLFAACGPAYDVEAAGEFLYNSYIYDEGKETFKNYQLVGVVIVEGITYNVEWSSNSPDITFEKDSTGKLVTVKVPNPNATAFSYELTAKISAPNGTSVEKKFNRVMPVTEADVSTSMLQENVAYKLFVQQMNQNGQKFYALNTTQDNQNKFINTTNVPQDGVDFYVEAVDGGYKIFTDISGVKTYVYAKTTVSEDGKISKYIGFDATQGSVFFYDEERGGVWMVTIDGADYGVGTYNSYTTLSLSEEGRFSTSSVGSTQFVMQFIKSSDANQLQPDEVPELNEDAAAVLNQLYALADGDSANGNFQLTGVITELDSYNNPTIVVTGFEDKPVYCYRLSNDAFVVGATITVNATQMKNYGGTYEFMNCTLVSIVPPAGGSDPVDPPAGGDDTTDTLVVVDAPVVGTAYKFGMIQSNVSATDVYYLAGGMSGFYMATTTDVAAAIDVYLEEADGGYYLYCYVGDTKTYINMVVSADGAHVNGAYEAAASTVYRFDADSKTLIASVNDVDQWFGTRNDKNYTTVGPCAVSYAGFYCQFYAAGTTEGGDPVDPPAGDDDACTNHVDANGNFVCDTKGCDAVVEPENGSTLTVAQVKLLASLLKGNSTNWYYVVAKVTQVYNTTHGNMYITDDDVDTVTVYGSFSADGSTRYDAMTDKPKAGDTVKFYSIITWSSATSNAQLKDARIIEYTAHTCQFSQADCTTAATCSICNTTQGEALGHNYVDGTCDRCGQGQPAANNKDDFNTINAGTPNSSYMDRESTNGWVAHNAAFNGHGTGSTTNPNFPTVFEADEYALTIKGTSTDPGKITSPTLQNGIATLTFNYAHLFTEANGVNLTINIKQGGEVVATTNLVKSNAEVVKLAVNLFTWNLDTAVEGDFVIEILNNCPSNNTGNKDRVSIWNITWVNA